MEYKTVDKTCIFSGMETNAIYSMGVKNVFVIKAQVVEEICPRTEHGKAKFLSSILTIAPLFLFLELSDTVCFISVKYQQWITQTWLVQSVCTSGVKNV